MQVKSDAPSSTTPGGIIVHLRHHCIVILLKTRLPHNLAKVLDIHINAISDTSKLVLQSQGSQLSTRPSTLKLRLADF